MLGKGKGYAGRERGEEGGNAGGRWGEGVLVVGQVLRCSLDLTPNAHSRALRTTGSGIAERVDGQGEKGGGIDQAGERGAERTYVWAWPG